MRTIFILAAIIITAQLNAQIFINSGKIEYEVKTNTHGAMGDDTWAEMFKDKIPQFATQYYSLTFDNNKSLYKFERLDEKNNMMWNEDDATGNIWYNNYPENNTIQQKTVFGDTYLLNDSLMNIQWKLSPNETREIAGFNCRKATAILFDSVYVFAFYTDEITVSGGPMSLHGLPGMIMGITIPRMYTSWIATKLQVNGVNTNIVTAPSKGKKKKTSELLQTVKKATSDWGNWGQRSIWSLYL